MQRTGLMSNSSSSSFILQRSKMTDEQVNQVFDYSNTAVKLNISFHDGWDIHDDGEFIRGSTIMDNDDMSTLLKKINLNYAAIISWENF